MNGRIGFAALVVFLVIGGFARAQVLINEISGDGVSPSVETVLAGVADLNGDGLGDLCVVDCIPLNPSNWAGWAARVRLISGRNGSLVWQHVSPGFAPVPFHLAVEDLGDLSGDGLTDIGIGLSSVQGFPSPLGLVQVLSGADGNPIHTLNGLLIGDTFGYSLAPAGDLDADGIPDFLVGAPAFTAGSIDLGSVHVFSGASAQPLMAPLLPNSSASVPGFGSELLVMSDFFSGLLGPELLVGWPAAGIIESFSLQNGAFGPVLSPCLSWFPPVENLGTDMAAMGDVNGDGIDDIAAASTLQTQGLAWDARVNLYAGGGSGSCVMDVSTPLTQGSSYTMAALPDQDGDGIRDLAVTNPSDVLVFSGSDGSMLFTLPGEAGSISSKVVAMDDLNGDGVAEIAVVARLTGTIRIWSGVPVPGTVTVLGSGYAPSGPAPVLASTPPSMPGPVTLSVSGAPPSTSGVLVAAPVPENPLGLFPGFVVQPDLFSIQDWMLLPITSSTAGTADLGFFLPLDPNLLFLEVVLQGWFPSPMGLAASALTNGLRLQVGLQ